MGKVDQIQGSFAKAVPMTDFSLLLILAMDTGVVQ